MSIKMNLFFVVLVVLGATMTIHAGPVDNNSEPPADSPPNGGAEGPNGEKFWPLFPFPGMSGFFGSPATPAPPPPPPPPPVIFINPPPPAPTTTPPTTTTAAPTPAPTPAPAP